MSEKIKYPRTMNLDWSCSNSSDDVWWKDCNRFEGKQVVVSEKLDGECTTIYRDGHVHARSLETSHHPSRSLVKALAGSISHMIPENWRLCGENVFAWHSIFYTDLPSYFFVYGIYNESNICIPWREVKAVCETIGLQTVPVIYEGIWDEELIRGLWKGKGAYPTFEVQNDTLCPEFPEDFAPCEAEGYVVRLAEAFPYDQFKVSCAKYVRENHVKTPTNWMQRPVIPNKLAS